MDYATAKSNTIASCHGTSQLEVSALLKISTESQIAKPFCAKKLMDFRLSDKEERYPPFSSSLHIQVWFGVL